MIEAARRGRDKNGVLQCAMVSQLGHSLNVETSSSRESSNQPTSFLKLRRDMLYAWQKRTAPWGEEVEVASAIRVLCVLKRAYKTGIAALSVAIPCASQKIVKCMIWAVHKTGSRFVSKPESKLNNGERWLPRTELCQLCTADHYKKEFTVNQQILF